MSESRNHASHGSENMPVAKREMSRRQFLSYTLGGTGGFMAAGILVPMIRFAVDPILKPKVEADWVKVVETSKITDSPQAFKFQIHQVDSWYESDPEIEAWVAKKGDEIYALNPTCKHLGCTVGYNNNAEFKDQFFCPCHGAHYTKEGKNLAVAPAPLDQYKVKVENGFVYLGQLGPNQIAKS